MNAKVLTLGGKDALTGAISKGGPLDKEGIDEAAAGAFTRGAVIQDYSIGDYPVYVTFGVIKIQISEEISDLSSEAELTPSGSDGKWKIGTTGNYIGAIALETGSVDDYIDVLIINPYIKENATTDEFTDFTDTPSAYTNGAGKGLFVNAAANAVEFKYQFSYANKTSDYTATMDDVMIGIDATGETVEITLPTAANVDGKLLIVKAENIDNAATIATDGSETIDGASSYTFQHANEVVGLVSDGTNWVKVFESGYRKSDYPQGLTSIDDGDSPYTVDGNTEHIIVADGTSGVVTINLPDPSTVTGKKFIFKAVDVSSTVKLSRNGSEEIDGSAADYTFATAQDAVTIVSDGTNWHKLSEFLNA